MSTSPRPANPAKKRPYRKPAQDPARRLAFDALRAVDERDAYANLVLPALLRKAEQDVNFTRRDAAFATELVYGTLRMRGSYDAIIAACVDRPLSRIDPPVLDVISLGAHQLLATRIPTHAAVSATVDLARTVLTDGPAKFVNAVLRKISQHDLDTWLEQVAPPYEDDAEEHLGVLHSHPRWVVSALWDALGVWQPDSAGRTAMEQLLAADNDRPAVTLVARPGRSTVTELREALDEDATEPGRWSPYAVRLAEGGDPADLKAVRENRAGVQDEGSQLVASALAAAPLEGGSDRVWLDGCAGPGGKAALLAALAAERGAALVASEAQPHRARLVARALEGNPGPYAVITADGTRPAWQPASFDRVLVDVPCSGLGALRRRPESRWRRRPSDVANFNPLQRALLRSAIDATRPGGVVGYATCSPHLAETRVVVNDVLKGRDDVEWIDARPLMPGVPDLGDGPDVQLWPHLHGTDAMYLALLRKK
ncbi:RsmB/NOP family class I SAM-dependent RNA methyltransferase [Streptacidiphilus fuscans]|uniref:rRNA cytosine-C5-methyltransferase n=1 Tax=Streptacidiphilus fuscans TaxID=2789292 RepID=A0A931FEK7_9ACTN|nr:transcription antitermination factor NusB [Streptacidiphilus fuscans]MBF9068751.1 rRNA cytosine-C5-methyltransferase [Streptacidiphilus fuscans]